MDFTGKLFWVCIKILCRLACATLPRSQKKVLYPIRFQTQIRWLPGKIFCYTLKQGSSCVEFASSTSLKSCCIDRVIFCPDWRPSIEEDGTKMRALSTVLIFTWGNNVQCISLFSFRTRSTRNGHNHRLSASGSNDSHSSAIGSPIRSQKTHQTLPQLTGFSICLLVVKLNTPSRTIWVFFKSLK